MWKDIEGWEGLYEISSDGEVRNKITKKSIIGDINNCGYRRVKLNNKNHNPKSQRFFVHRLVAKTFLLNPNNCDEVNHLDCNTLNNNVYNLEWTTRKENERHSHKNGNKEYKPFIVLYNDGTKKKYNFKIDLAEELGLTNATIKYWLHERNKGYLKYGITSIKYIQ